jgi:hypothetical protein
LTSNAGYGQDAALEYNVNRIAVDFAPKPPIER